MSRLRRCTSRTIWRRSGRCSNGCRSSRRSLASIPRSTGASRRSRRRSRFPKAITDRGVIRYGFHGLSYEYVAQASCRQYDCACRRWQGRRAASGQRLEHVRDRGRPQRREHDGIHRRRRAADGHPLRKPRPRRDALPDGRARDGRARDREAHLPAVGPARRVGDFQRHARRSRPATSRGAKAAIDLYVYRIGRELGSLAAALGGLDAIVFTAGIGENSRSLRERVCRDAAMARRRSWMPTPTARGAGRISTAASRVSAWVIPTNEELMIARHTRDVLGMRNE